MNSHNASKKKNLQMIWGIALMLAGIGVFIRIPQVMPKLTQIEQFANAAGFIRFCFYLMGVILIGGGAKKVLSYFRSSATPSLEESDDSADQ